MSTEYETLFDIFNDINITIINNNLAMKDKIIKRINIIKKLVNTNINVLNYTNVKKDNLFNILKSLNYKLMSVKKNHSKLNVKLNTILGLIIHNAYLSSEYQVLLSNIPNSAKQIVDNKINIIDIESIYDTIEHYIGKNRVIKVIQIDNDKYLIKFKDINDAEKLCNLINNMMIEPNIITAKIIKNDKIEDIDIDIEIEYNTIKKNDNEICNNGVGKLDNISLFKICIHLAYTKYKNIQEKIKNNINYILSFIKTPT
jgi:hypothetical protein